MIVLGEQEENTIRLTDFDIELAIEKLKEGCALAPFWSDHIYKKLQSNLQNFYEENKSFYHKKGNQN